MRVLFMGTPDFAAVCLERLLKEPDLQLTVVTQPDPTYQPSIIIFKIFD